MWTFSPHILDPTYGSLPGAEIGQCYLASNPDSLCLDVLLQLLLRGSSKLSSLGPGTRPQGMSGAVPGQGQAGDQGKVLSPEGAGHCPGSPGNGHGPEAARAPGAFGHHSQAQGRIVGVSVQGQGL